MLKLAKVLVLAAAATHLAVAPLAYSTSAYALAGDVSLPSPYVSRALDAVLLPIDDVVRDTFVLDPADEGVLVLAVEPGGVADSLGLEPGDVIAAVHGHKIVDPIELDEIVYYWILQGDFDFLFDVYRAGVLSTASWVITLELYEAAIDMASVASWTAWSVETSFSYEEFYAEYSEELTETYESSETIIEETVSSEEFTSEEEFSEEDSDGDGIMDSEDGDDDGDGVDDADDSDDDGMDDADDDSGDDGDDGGDDGDDGGEEE
ncbi:MAG: PDZ domain-containing protein [Candidatus Devosia phytovorans]|uniref:PDZ domain-containing protein n=1 Tax=Candidatus Devosia phytovorans TaxID=3121372 RepID=A0AAJ5VTN2_9HYPH|nr:PDZ domain-containing protein [Devosia sp.]WEK03985.1 MAG: PDZ domain-containing protein [Devosia sp.]